MELPQLLSKIFHNFFFSLSFLLMFKMSEIVDVEHVLPAFLDLFCTQIIERIIIERLRDAGTSIRSP